MKKIFDENGLLSGKRVLAATLVMGLLSSMTFFSAAAGHTWESQGNVVAEKSDGTKVTVFDKSDLDYLDGRIDAIEADVSTGKENLANALNPLGTNPSLGTPLSGTSTFNELMEAINHSQAIPDKTIGESVSIATEDYELASTVTGQTINSDTKISAATADNLSLGTSAWVDGSLLIGTGADNKNYYDQGYAKGTADALGSVNIKYTYHQHQSSCYSQCEGRLIFVRDTNAHESEYKCSNCGRIYYLGGGTGQYTNTQCQNIFTICGKTTSTIESATIDF